MTASDYKLTVYFYAEYKTTIEIYKLIWYNFVLIT